MLDLDVRYITKPVDRMLTDIEKKQIPFASSQALNDTAFDGRKALRVQAVHKLDRPTKFTINGFQVVKSKKSNLVAVVFIHPTRWKYLKYQVEGGSRKGVVPRNVKLNKFGNIPGRLKKSRLWGRGKGVKKNQFVGTINGTHGVWERQGKRGDRVKLIAVFESRVTYRSRLPFDKIVAGIVKNKFPRHFDRRMQRALDTARY